MKSRIFLSAVCMMVSLPVFAGQQATTALQILRLVFTSVPAGWHPIIREKLDTSLPVEGMRAKIVRIPVEAAANPWPAFNPQSNLGRYYQQAGDPSTRAQGIFLEHQMPGLIALVGMLSRSSHVQAAELAQKMAAVLSKPGAPTQTVQQQWQSPSGRCVVELNAHTAILGSGITVDSLTLQPKGWVTPHYALTVPTPVDAQTWVSKGPHTLENIPIALYELETAMPDLIGRFVARLSEQHVPYRSMCYMLAPHDQRLIVDFFNLNDALRWAEKVCFFTAGEARIICDLGSIAANLEQNARTVLQRNGVKFRLVRFSPVDMPHVDVTFNSDEDSKSWQAKGPHSVAISNLVTLDVRQAKNTP